MTDWLTRDPEDRHLLAPPLTLVVCQVRHEQQLAASDPARALRIRDALGWQATLAEGVAQELNITLDAAGVSTAQSPPSRGWQLASADGVWTATVMPSHYSIETREYPGWEGFRERLIRLTEAVGEHVAPVLENRVGLRFVNQITHQAVQNPADWRGRISPLLLQDELLNGLGDQLQAALQVLDIRPAADLGLLVRHGCQRVDGTRLAYLLDNDCSRHDPREFSPDAIGRDLDRLHRVALQAFEMATTQELRDELEKEQA